MGCSFCKDQSPEEEDVNNGLEDASPQQIIGQDAAGFNVVELDAGHAQDDNEYKVGQ